MTVDEGLERIDLRVTVLDQTATAVKVATNFRPLGEWVPFSLATISGEKSDGTATLNITRALAATRGLA